MLQERDPGHGIHMHEIKRHGVQFDGQAGGEGPNKPIAATSLATSTKKALAFRSPLACSAQRPSTASKPSTTKPSASTTTTAVTAT